MFPTALSTVRGRRKPLRMKPLEIEQAVSALVEAPFDVAEFPFQFLQAFGNRETTLKRLRAGDTNHSDVDGLLQRGNIHLKVAALGEVALTLDALRASPATGRQKAKFILATDGQILQVENLTTGESRSCDYRDFPLEVDFLHPLAGIAYVTPPEESKIDVKASKRLNRLYVELLKTNPDWETDVRREELNHFFARLIFCFFAEDTGIFDQADRFTNTLAKTTTPDGSDTHFVLSTLFRAMNMRREDRAAPDLPAWAMNFEYVNGNLFSGSTETPRFSKIARSYLLGCGRDLNWKLINPDIFGSMIQAVADDEERGALGMHYTSVPNILKVLNPLCLDDLRQKLAEAGDSPIKLLNLRKRLARIRVFDPACGSGNFLVIAYIKMREIEAIVNERRGEKELPSAIPMTNFRGIEIRGFAAEIARLALIIARFQCDSLHIGDLFARRQLLPLDKENWITKGNALELDWLKLCPPTETGVKVENSEGLLYPEKLNQAEIDFENVGGETYICGNPPYAGATVTAPRGASKETKAKLKKESERRKADLQQIFGESIDGWKSLDYVSGWFYRFCLYTVSCRADAAFVSTNSISQGQQVSLLWPHIFRHDVSISFARTSFKWKNLASKNAGVTVVVIGLRKSNATRPILFDEADPSNPIQRQVDYIGAYLVPNIDVIVPPARKPLNGLPEMDYGSKPADGGGLIVSAHEFERLSDEVARRFIKPYIGSDDYIDGKVRYCLWVKAGEANEAETSDFVTRRAIRVKAFRSESDKTQTRELASSPLQFAEVRHEDDSNSPPMVIPIHTGEDRSFLPVGALPPGAVVSNAAYGLYNAPLWCMALIGSRLHLTWIAAVCGKLETRYRYSNTLGWNTFPRPREGFSESNKAELTRRAEEILLAREAHFPATIADLYEPDKMPADLRLAHDRNDEYLEQVYIGRRFRNDTERLEKLFELYTEMIAKAAKVNAKPAGRKRKDVDA